MKLIGTVSWSGECDCCGESNKRIFLIQHNFLGRTAEWNMCADCAAEEEEIEHYKQQQRCAP